MNDRPSPDIPTGYERCTVTSRAKDGKHDHRCVRLIDPRVQSDHVDPHRCALCFVEFEPAFETTQSDVTESDVEGDHDLGSILTQRNPAAVTHSDGGEGSTRNVTTPRPTLHRAASLSVTPREGGGVFAQVTGLPGSRDGNTAYTDVERLATTARSSTESDGDGVTESEITMGDPGYDRSQSRPVVTDADGWALRAATALRDVRSAYDWLFDPAKYTGVDITYPRRRLDRASSTLSDLTGWLATRQRHPLGVGYEQTGEELLPTEPWWAPGEAPGEMRGEDVPESLRRKGFTPNPDGCPAATGNVTESKRCPVWGSAHLCMLKAPPHAEHACECGVKWVGVTNLDEQLRAVSESSARKALRDKGIGRLVDVSVHEQSGFFDDGRTVLVRISGKSEDGKRKWGFHLPIDRYGEFDIAPGHYRGLPQVRISRPVLEALEDNGFTVVTEGASYEDGGLVVAIERAPLPPARPVLREDVAAEQMHEVSPTQVRPGTWFRIQELIAESKHADRDSTDRHNFHKEHEFPGGCLRCAQELREEIAGIPTAERVDPDVSGFARRMEVLEKRFMRLAGELGTEIEARTDGDNAAYDLARAVGERVDVLMDQHRHPIDHDNPLLHRLSELQGRVLALEYGTRVAGLGQGPTVLDLEKLIGQFGDRLTAVDRLAGDVDRMATLGAELERRLDRLENTLTRFAPDEFTPSDEMQELIEQYERGGFTPSEFKHRLRRLHSRLLQHETVAGSTDPADGGTVTG